MGKKKHNRSLTSRKRAKDVSSAHIDNVYSKEKMIADAVPRADFETALPRAVRNIQKSMQRLKDRESGVQTKPQYFYREDLPRSSNEPHRKKKKMKMAAGEQSTATAEVQPAQIDGGDGQQQGKSKHKNKRKDPDAMPGETDVRYVSTEVADTHTAGVGSRIHALGQALGAKKRRIGQAEDTRVRVPRFGETNDAPPSLVIGGQLSKQIARVTGAASKMDAIARQRQIAIEAYAKAKAARREGEADARR